MINTGLLIINSDPDLKIDVNLTSNNHTAHSEFFVGYKLADLKLRKIDPHFPEPRTLEIQIRLHWEIMDYNHIA